MIQTVQKTESGYLVNGVMNVPNAPGNRHYQEVQKWIKQGNTPDPILEKPPVAPDETEALIQQEMRQMAIERLQAKGKLTADGKAKELSETK